MCLQVSVLIICAEQSSLSNICDGSNIEIIVVFCLVVRCMSELSSLSWKRQLYVFYIIPLRKEYIMRWKPYLCELELKHLDNDKINRWSSDSRGKFNQFIRVFLGGKASLDNSQFFPWIYLFKFISISKVLLCQWQTSVISTE